MPSPPPQLQPFNPVSGSEAGKRSAQSRQLKSLRLQQLETLVEGLTAQNVRQVAVEVQRSQSAKDLAILIRATKDRIAHCYAHLFPGYAREVRELAGALTEFRRQESILLDRPRKRTGAQSSDHGSRNRSAKPRSQPTPAAAGPATTGGAAVP